VDFTVCGAHRHRLEPHHSQASERTGYDALVD
jgi:hypothetical protein